ncbi:MAG: beta-ketoacyl synthase chain length factor [Bacteroidales bacterium]|nr:beta-ketoacyl synthase chain length factor [Bacteroidales bacterium]
MPIYVLSANQISLQQPLSQDWMHDPVLPTEPFTRSIDPDYRPYVSPIEARRMGKLLKRALATSIQTLRDTGIEHPDAIITGTGLGSVESTEAFLLDMCRNGEQLLKPTHFMQSTHNTIGSLVAIQTKSHGYNATYSHKQISFECALYDAWLQMRTSAINNALVLGQDATTPNYYHLFNLVGYDGPEMKCTCGEASVATMLATSVPEGQTPLCQLRGVSLMHTPDNRRVAAALERMQVPADVVVLAGYNGLAANDVMYDRLLADVLSQAQVLHYKQLFGESYSASALGFYAAAHWIGSGQYRQILLMTIDRSGDVALTLLEK